MIFKIKKKKIKVRKEMFAISNLLAASGMTLHKKLHNVSRESLKPF